MITFTSYLLLFIITTAYGEQYKPYQLSQMTDTLEENKTTHPLLAYPLLPGTPVSEKERKSVEQLQKEIASASANNKGVLLLQLGHAQLVDGCPDRARDAYTAAAAFKAQAELAHHGVCTTHQFEGESGKAVSCYNRILEDNPNFAPARYARAMAHLARGNFAAGWHYLEPFLQAAGKNSDELRAALKNNTLTGKTVVLTAEGGFGDTYQWVRYGQALQAKGAQVIAMVQKPLVASVAEASLFPVLPLGSEIPKGAITASIMSLPAIFNADEHTIPNAPYLHANPELVAQWQQKLASDKNKKIGICWQASVQNDMGRLPMGRRGIPLDTIFAHAAEHNDLSLYSLQQFDGVEQLETVAFKDRIKQFPKDFDRTNGAFRDTGAVIKNLDAVVTVDTGLAHYAAGLGAKVILILPYSADFRWTEDRTDSTYYPNLHVIKQQKPFEWHDVAEQLNDLLHTQILK